MPSRTPPALLIALVVLNLWTAFAAASTPLARASTNGQPAQTRTQSPAVPVAAAGRSPLLPLRRLIDLHAIETPAIRASQREITRERRSHRTTLVDGRLFSLRI